MQFDIDMAATALLGIHAGFPFLLLVTIRWWWDRASELVALLVLNHCVSFVVAAFIPW